MLGVEAPSKASLPLPQQGELCMRVHSPWVGVCDPSWIDKHWDPCGPLVGCVAPQVEAPSDHCEG